MLQLRLPRIVILLLVTCAASADTLRGQANDDWASRRQILVLPFSVTEGDASFATVAGTDPAPPCPSSSTDPLLHTMWYGYTAGAATEYLTLQIPSATNGQIGVYTGTPGAFRLVSGGCSGRGATPTLVPRIVGLRLAAGSSISIIIGSHFPLAVNESIQFSVASSLIHQVTKTADTLDGGCDGDCSLREAIQASNTSPGVVLVPAGTYALAMVGDRDNNNATGDLDLRESMAVYGAGNALTIVDAMTADRAFDLAATVSCCRTFLIGDLQIANGRTPIDLGDEGRGGGIRVQNAESYFGLERLLIRNSAARSSGGGMYLRPTGTFREIEIRDSTSTITGGGLAYLGNAPLDIEASAFIGNSTQFGGGLYVAGTLRIANSTIARNIATRQGGGINVDSSGSFALASSTVVDNHAGDHPLDLDSGGGLRLRSNGAKLVINSIIAGNSGSNPADPPDCALIDGSLSTRYNHVERPGTCVFASIGDVTGSDPILATLPAAHGGPTRTYALLTGSPALDSADPVGCADAFGTLLPNDQRGSGFARVVGAACDKGALESPLVTPPGIPTLDPLSDSGDSNQDELTNVQLATFNGGCVDGTTIQLHAANALLPTAACNASSYSITLSSALPEGVHAVSATASNGVIASLKSTPLPVTIDISAPSPPTIIGPAFSLPLALLVNGSASETLGRVSVLEGAVERCSGSVDAQSGWNCALTLDGAGAHALTARHTDVAGNAGAASAPFIIAISDALLSDGFEGL